MSKAVYCPNCGLQAPASAINLSEMLAKCENCNKIYSIKEQTGSQQVIRPKVALPAGISAIHYTDGLDIEVKWRNSASSFMLFFTIFWNIVVLPFGLFGFMTGNWGMLLACSIHMVVGIGLLYFMIASLMNTTYIYLDNSFLSIQHCPFAVPWYPDREIEVSQIEQLSVQRYSPSKTNGKPDYFFAVHAKLKNGKQLKVLRGLKRIEQGRYLEQEIERFLEIPDEG